MDRSVPVTIPVDQLTSGGQEYGLAGRVGFASYMLRTDIGADENKPALRLKLSR